MLDLTATIVTHNSDFVLLERTVFSFQKNSLKSELIICDNNSAPEYRTKLSSLNADKIIDLPNKGFGYGHNRASEHSSESKYHLILNPDVEIPEGNLERMVDFLDQNQDIGLLCPKILNTDGSIQMLNKRQPSVFNLFARRFIPASIQNWSPLRKKMDYYIMLDKGYNSNYEVPYLSGCFMLFKKKLYEELNGFDERFFMYLEDADITKRAGKNHKCIFYSETSIIHHWNRGSHKSLKLTWISVVSSFKYFRKWGLKIF